MVHVSVGNIKRELKIEEGKLAPVTWPDVGVGRINLDGSRGSCTSCHTRHRLSVMEARKPEACGQCHLGPDYTWWRGFYECKKRFINFMEEANDLLNHNKKAYIAKDFPGATGSTNNPPQVAPIAR